VRRFLTAFAYISRWREILRCAAITSQWPRLTAAYVGLPVRLPFSITLASGEFEFREFSDIPTFWQIFFRDVYPVQPDDQLIIDAGANIGAFTLYCLLRAPQAFVIAIEPAHDSCKRLRDLIDRHGFADRCVIHQAALADCRGTTTIDMDTGSQFRVTGRGGVEIPTLTLDSIAAPYKTVDLLKIDVEGAEYQVLPAASPDILRRIRRIEMEYHPSDDPQVLFQRLSDHGFSLDAVHDQGGGYGTARLFLERAVSTQKQTPETTETPAS
jgi:FkbM family methyltransferase